MTTAEVIPYFLDKLWTGLKNVPVLDFGFSFADLYIGLVMISAAMWLLRTFFGINGGIDSMAARAGRNHRRDKKVLKEAGVSSQQELLSTINARYRATH